jgi:flagellar FliL protein
MSKKVLILSAAAVVLVGAGTAAFLLMRPAPAKAEAEAHGEVPAEDLTIVTMETFLVNLASPEGDRFAKVDLQLAMTPPEAAHAVSEDALLAAQLRDRVLTLLTSKAAEELLTPVGKEGLRRELKASLNPLLHEGEIHEVLFSNFVVQ